MNHSIIEKIPIIEIQKELKLITESDKKILFWEIQFSEWLAEELHIHTTFRFYIEEFENNKDVILPPTYKNTTYYELLVYFQDATTALIFYYILGILSGELILDSLGDYQEELISGEITEETWSVITEGVVIFCRDSIFGKRITPQEE